MTTDLKNFNHIFGEYQQRFIRFASNYTHNETVAEDFVIESFIYYWENKDRLPKETNIPAYVLTTIKHKCIDYLRHQQIHKNVSDELLKLQSWDLSERISTLEDFEPYEVFTVEIQEIVDKTLTSLPLQTRNIFMMSRYENKSHKDIANMLGISTKSVEFHISKAIKALRPALKDYLPVIIFFL